MQELILVISRCMSVANIKSNLKSKTKLEAKSAEKENCFYRFHFKGYYLGQKIKIIHLFPSISKIESGLEKESFIRGDDYLLWVKQRRVNLEILEVDLIKYKKIS